MRDTELRLAAWRDGSTQAERLAAAIIRLAGYEGIDPQAPIGGPGGGKDIICNKGGIKWTCAVYFPPTAVTFNSVRKKFLSDLAKVADASRGFVFVTNRPITPTQKKALESAATAARKDVDIFQLERLRALLDAPNGYGVRLQFLSIAMAVEEQLSWFEDSGDRVLNALTVNTRELLGIKALLQGMAKSNAEIVRTMSVIGMTAPPTPDLLSTANFSAPIPTRPISATINVPQILFVHRLACFDMPTKNVGMLRRVDVWLANSDGDRAEHLQPPTAETVPLLLDDLCATWRDNYAALTNAPVDRRLNAIARFHTKFLIIHPFLDGNGRLSRALLMQQCLDLFGIANMSLLDQGAAYYRALKAADAEDFAPLITLLKPVVDL
jgi:hypothetical protein